MSNYARHLKSTPQSEPLNERQVKNNAGGYVFTVSPTHALTRFLILGSDGGTYYASEEKHTRENARVVQAALTELGTDAVDIIRQVSVEGRAPRNKPALFALALAASHGIGSFDTPAAMKVRQQAFLVLPDVARTASDLLWFCSQVYQLRGKGTGLRNAVRRWFTMKDPQALAWQAMKYRQRDGWALRDLLRLSKPTPESEAQSAIFRWLTAGTDEALLPDMGVDNLRQAHYLINKGEAFTSTEAADAIRRFKLPWEVVPDSLKGDVIVWEALLEHMPMHAMVRQLGKLTSVGALAGKGLDRVLDLLENTEALHKSRMHPYALLQAASVYGQGHGFKGSLNWDPVHQVSIALETAFYKSFQNVVPSGKNILLGLDVSGSMGTAALSNSPLTAREASMAMALVTMTTERHAQAMAFSHELVPLKLPIGLRAAIDHTARIPFGRTDCALPMRYATEKQLKIDQFIIYTDNETWHGREHPMEALKRYRQQSGIAASLVVVGMTATKFTIADPRDAKTLDVVGFDSSTPAVLSWFAGGQSEASVED